MRNLLFTLFAVLLITQSQAAFQDHTMLFSSQAPIEQIDVNTYVSSPNVRPADLISQCGPFQIVGGYDEINNANSLFLHFEGLKSHTQIRLTFDLFMVDWEGPANERLDVFAEGNKVGDYIMDGNFQVLGNMCGANQGPDWSDRKTTVSFVFNHDNCDVDIELDMWSDGPWEWFGIQNLLVEINTPELGFDEDLWHMADSSSQWAQPDDTPGIGAFVEQGNVCYLPDGSVEPGCVVFNDCGERCWMIIEAQECFDMLGNLDNEGYHVDDEGNMTYGDIVSTCRSVEDNGQWSFDFLISYIDDENPYTHHDQCFEQEVQFVESGTDYNADVHDNDFRTTKIVTPATQDKADGIHDMWWWNQCTEQVTFTIDLDDLVDEWLCTYTEYDDHYEWVCTIQFNIYFAGCLQYCYEFQMCSILDRTTSASLDVAVNRNVVYGDCCVNELQVNSSLHFCSDFNCVTDGQQRLEVPSDWQNGIKEVERREIFYVAHRIDTSEFQEYFLQPISLMIGPFVPEIHNWQQIEHPDTFSGQGHTHLLVYELESYVALDNLTITSVALLDDRDWQAGNSDFDQDGDFVQPDGYDGLDFNASRRLEEQSETIGEDYKIMSENKMSVSSSDDENKQGKKAKENNAQLLSFLGLVMLAMLI